jgi:hypothetical protein
MIISCNFAMVTGQRKRAAEWFSGLHTKLYPFGVITLSRCFICSAERNLEEETYTQVKTAVIIMRRDFYNMRLFFLFDFKGLSFLICKSGTCR